MFFDKEWMENLIELQKKSRELSEEVTWPKEYVDVIMQAIENSSKNPGSFKAPDYTQGFNDLWNIGIQSTYEDIYEPKINITETVKAILVKAAIPVSKIRTISLLKYMVISLIFQQDKQKCARKS